MPAESKGFLAGRLHRIAAVSLLTVLGCALDSNISSAFAQARRPEEVKGAFLYNFMRFVEWPAKAFDTPESPFVIGIAGDEDVASDLQSIVKNERVGNRRLQVRTIRRVRDAQECHLLYVGNADRGRVGEFLDTTKGRPVLTVGETSDFLRQGGIIQFVTERTIRLKISVRNARAGNLTISSQLLRLAEIEKQ